MPRALKFTLIGCGGLFGLLVLVVACAAVISGGSDTSPTAPPADKAEEKPAEKEEAPPKEKQKATPKEKEDPVVGIGESLEVGDVQWTVTNARRETQLSQESFGQFGDTKQGNFVVVDLSFRNNDSDPASLTTNSLTLLDSGGRESQTDTDTFGYIEPDRNILLEQINPGVTKEGTVIFTVSPDASGFRLQLGDAALFSNEQGVVDLGF